MPKEITEYIKLTREDGRTIHFINRGTRYQPYVICWNFTERGWDWGHYFEDYVAAADFYWKLADEHEF